MNSLVRAGLTVALALPLGLPSAAFSFAPRPAGVSPTNLGHAHPDAGSVFEAMHLHHAKKTAHFAFPYGIAIDAAGNLYVANADANNVVVVSPEFKVLPATITQGIGSPVSVATDTYGNVYVGNRGGSNGGYVQKYNASFAYVQTFTANATAPFGIAVDQAQDLFVTSNGIALDDPYGNSISSSIYAGQPVYSVSVAGPTVYGFYSSGVALGNLSVALRTQALQGVNGPWPSVEPIGATCSVRNTICWQDDASVNSLTRGQIGGANFSIGLGYQPAGIAVDELRNRLYVANPQKNAIEVYTDNTLVFEKELT